MKCTGVEKVLLVQPWRGSLARQVEWDSWCLDLLGFSVVVVALLYWNPLYRLSPPPPTTFKSHYRYSLLHYCILFGHKSSESSCSSRKAKEKAAGRDRREKILWPIFLPLLFLLLKNVFSKVLTFTIGEKNTSMLAHLPDIPLSLIL